MSDLEMIVYILLMCYMKKKISAGDYELLKEFAETYRHNHQNKEIKIDDIAEAPFYPPVVPEKMFYDKLVGFLSNDIKNNLTVYMDVYTEYNSHKHPDWYREVSNIQADKLQERIVDYSKRAVSNTEYEKGFCCFLISAWLNKDNPEADSLFTLVVGNGDNLLKITKIENLLSRDARHNDSLDNCQEILGDVPLKDFVGQCRKLLAERLDTTDKKLNDVLAKLADEKAGFPEVYLDSHGWTSLWCEKSWAKDKKHKNIFKCLDINQIISDYFVYKVLNVYRNNPGRAEKVFGRRLSKDSSGSYNKAEITSTAKDYAEFVSKDEDADRLSLLINTDIINRLFSFTTKELYQYQLNDLMGLSSSGMDCRQLNAELSECKDKLRETNIKLQKAYAENSRLQTEKTNIADSMARAKENAKQKDEEMKQLNDEHSREVRILQAKNESLSQEMEYHLEPDDYFANMIFYLQNQLEDCRDSLRRDRELIDQLLPSEEELKDALPAVNEEDLAKIYNKRIVFVGNLQVAGLQDLPQIFRESEFFETESGYLSQYPEGDYVVLLVKYMSHGMFYALRSNYILSQKPWIYFNQKNRDLLIKKIYYGIMEADAENEKAAESRQSNSEDESRDDFEEIRKYVGEHR